ncbi:MAG: transposase [Firmicutes bacterium]|nr:transposase [Bacillota bacterium]
MAKTEKRYNKEFKDGVVRLVLDNGLRVASEAKDLGISEQTVYRWLDQQKTR